MPFGTSLFLIALGAILRYAVHTSVRGFSVHTVGLILMIVGVVGLVLSLLWMTVWSRQRERAVRYHDGDYPPRDYPPPGV